MTATSIASTDTKPTFDRTARENRLAILAHRDANKLAMVSLTGNTFPLQKFLYAQGSFWNKEVKAVQVSSHVHEMCQKAIDDYAATHVKVKATKADKPAVTITAKEVKSAAVVDTRPAIKGTATQATLCKRLANLGEMTDTLVTDLLQAGLAESAASAVKALAIFNQEHAALLK
jgi:hypothetical protein